MQAPIFCRPAGVEFFAQPLEPVDLSLGGLRVCSRDEHPVGSVLRLDVFFPHVAPVTLTAQVMWTQASGKGGAAPFDLGFAFIRLHPDVVSLLHTWLGPEDEASPRESMVDQVRGPVDSSVRDRQSDPGTDPDREVRRPTSAPPPSDAGPRRDAPSILSAIPVVAVDSRTLGTTQLGRAGFLLWLIDGFVTVETLLELTGKPVEETLALLQDLLDRGVVKLRWRGPPSVRTRR